MSILFLSWKILNFLFPIFILIGNFIFISNSDIFVYLGIGDVLESRSRVSNREKSQFFCFSVSSLGLGVVSENRDCFTLYKTASEGK